MIAWIRSLFTKPPPPPRLPEETAVLEAVIASIRQQPQNWQTWRGGRTLLSLDRSVSVGDAGPGTVYFLDGGDEVEGSPELKAAVAEWYAAERRERLLRVAAEVAPTPHPTSEEDSL